MSKASLELGGGNWGTKDGNLLAYAQGNESSNLVPREFTFTRGSDIAATRINSSGLIEKYRENLLLHSNGFNNWTNSNTTETSGQSGYDGSSDAWLLEKSLASGFIFRSFSGSGVYTLSLYAKAGTLNSVLLLILASGGNGDAYFNLSTGVVDQFGNNAFDAQIEDVGGGWYRCSLIGNYTSISQVRIYPANNQGIADTSGTIYIQDAQVEQGLVATSYLESGATTATSGVADNEPRIDYAGGTGSLLLEPSRTQLIPYTEYLSGLSLSGNPPTITQNYAVSPEGVQNAVRIQDTDAANFKIMQTQFSVTAGSTYTISVYVKKATSPISTYGGFYFDFDGGTRKTSNLIFDEYNGTLVNASGNAITSVIHPVIDEGDYWRFSATATDTGSNTLLRPTLRAGASANGTTLNLVTKDYTAYGFQCEQGSYPTSYIPNHSGGSETRSKDTGSLDMITAGITTGLTSATLFIEYEKPYTGEGVDTFRMHGTSTNGRAYIYNTGVGFASDWAIAGGHTIGETTKHIWRLDSLSEGTRFRNGAIENTGSGTAWSDIRYMYLNNQGLGGILKIKQILLFPTALSDADCITLTTL